MASFHNDDLGSLEHRADNPLACSKRLVDMRHRMAGHARRIVLIIIVFILLAGTAVRQIFVANARADAWEKKSKELTRSLAEAGREKAAADVVIVSLRTELARLEADIREAKWTFDRQECIKLLVNTHNNKRSVNNKNRIAVTATALHRDGRDPLEGFVDSEGRPIPGGDIRNAKYESFSDQGGLYEAENEVKTNFTDHDVSHHEQISGNDSHTMIAVPHQEGEEDVSLQALPAGINPLEGLHSEEDRSAWFEDVR